MFEKGKAMMIFRTEVPPEHLQEHLEDAFDRFETTQENYTIRVFKTSEIMTRRNQRQNVEFLTIKVTAGDFHTVAKKMTPVLNYLAMLEYGIKSGHRFYIDDNTRNIEIPAMKVLIPAKDIFRANYSPTLA